MPRLLMTVPEAAKALAIPGLPGHCAAAPAVRVLPRRGLHRGTSRRAAQPAMERH